MFRFPALIFRRALWLIIFLLTTVPLVMLGGWHIDTGYANNGDFPRSIAFLFDHAVGLSDIYVPEGDPEHGRMFFNAWLDQWVIRGEGIRFRDVGAESFYRFYLLSQVFLTSWSEHGSSLYSMAKGSWLSRAILYSSLLIFVLQFYRRFPLWLLWVGLTALSVLFLETAWVAYLNSFYEEQVAFIIFPWLALALSQYLMRRRELDLWIVLLLAFILGWSKTAYFYLPTLIFGFLLCFGLKSKRKLFFVWFVCQLVAFYPVVAGKYKHVNPYHSVYYGALMTLSSDELGQVSDVGKGAIVKNCIGVAVFFADGERCMEQAKIRRLDLVDVIAQKPQILPRMLGRALSEGREIDLSYLGKAEEGHETRASLPVFNGWKWLFRHGAQYMAFALTVLGVCLTLFRGAERADPLLAAGVFVLVFGWSQYFAALGDGFYELPKHLSIGNYALALGTILSITGLFSVALTQRRVGKIRLQDQ